MSSSTSNSANTHPQATDFTTCGAAGVCGGCPWIEVPHQEQEVRKRRNLEEAFRQNGVSSACIGAAPYLVPAWSGLRERADLILANGVLGMMGAGASGGGTPVEMVRCTALSGSALEMYEDFKKDLPGEVRRGSVRLRVAPDGRRGVWLDLANGDIKRLLDDGVWLRKLLARFTVEMGQKRKQVVLGMSQPGGGQSKGSGGRGESGLRFVDADLPGLQSWTSSFFEGKEIPLYSTVGSFSQPGRIGTRVLVEHVLQLLKRIKGEGTTHCLELGAGIGTFSLPLALSGARVTAWEMDELAILGLTKGRDGLGLSHDRLKIANERFHSAGLSQLLRDSKVDVILADPPRSGLGDFVTNLAATPADRMPRNFVYVSCFAESFARDLAGLEKCGFHLADLALVDQFPQTPHCEYVALLIRDQ